MKTILEFLQKKKIEKAIADSNYEAVDLGLSVKWASCNIGAESPEDYGLFFQWGRTDGYKHGSDPGTSFKAKDGLVQDKTTPPTHMNYHSGDTLEMQDDAAHINMGGKWRMPTSEEIRELNKLEYEYTILNGKYVLKLINPKTGNRIYIPCAGHWQPSSKFGNDKYECGLWSSEVSYTGENHAKLLLTHFKSLNEPAIAVTAFPRSMAYPIRAVCD